MKKFLVVILIILSSCGTRKRVLEKEQTIYSSVEQNDIVFSSDYNLKTQVYKVEQGFKKTYTAQDNSKPFKVNGQEYENVILVEESETIIDSTKVEESKKANLKDNSKKEIDLTKNKKNMTVDRDNRFGFWDWFWMLLAFAIVIFIMVKRNQIFEMVNRITS